MTREGERELVKVEHVNGGDGYMTLKHRKHTMQKQMQEAAR